MIFKYKKIIKNYKKKKKVFFFLNFRIEKGKFETVQEVIENIVCKGKKKNVI